MTVNSGRQKEKCLKPLGDREVSYLDIRWVTGDGIHFSNRPFRNTCDVLLRMTMMSF